jgi:hypothetical protein
MKVHPFIAAAAMLLAGVMALAASTVVHHQKVRSRRPPPVPDVGVDDERLAPRQVRPTFEVAPARPTPPPSSPARAELHVHVTGPHGVEVEDVDVEAHRRGDPPEAWNVLDAEGEDDAVGAQGRYASSDLVPGRYDLRVEAPGMRTVRVDDVPTGPRGVEVALARSPALVGSVGALAAEGCAGTTVTWSVGAETGEAAVDDDGCTFAVEVLPDAGPVTVVARKGSATARALVTPPLSGDPAVACLAPPCDSEPASLLVYAADTNHRQVDDAVLNWTLQGDELRGAMGTSMGAGLLFVHGRRAGETLALSAVRGDQAVQTTVVLGRGITEVLLTLPVAASEADDDADQDAPAPIEKRVVIRR